MVSANVILVVIIETFAMLALLVVYATRYKKVPPDKAMVVYGRKMHPGMKIGYQVISGGGKFILPIIESRAYMDMGAMGIELDMDDLETTHKGTPAKARCCVTAVVKVSSRKDALYVAAENLLDKSTDELIALSEIVLEGTTRAIFRHNEFEDLDKEYNYWATLIHKNAEGDLLNIGLEILCLHVHELELKGVP